MKLVKITLITVSLFFVSALIAQAIHHNQKDQQNGFSTMQQAQIEKIVHDYLVSNPEVLVEASHRLRQKEMLNMQKAAIKATRNNAEQLLNAPLSPIVGNTKGRVSLIAFLDYQCMHCRAMTDIIAKLIQKNSNLRVVFKEFPIFGPNSQRAARFALAANLQHKYFALHQAFMHSKIPFTKANILKMAKKVGLNIHELVKDMKSKAITIELKQNYTLAQDLKLLGTPAFIITKTNFVQNTNQAIKFVPGQTSEDDLQSIIDQLK